MKKNKGKERVLRISFILWQVVTKDFSDKRGHLCRDSGANESWRKARAFQVEEIARTKITREEGTSCGQQMTRKPVWLEQWQELKKRAKNLLETNLTKPLAIDQRRPWSLL